MARDYENYSKDALIVHIRELEKQLKNNKYGLYWDKSIEQEDVVIQCMNHIPVLKRDEESCLMDNPETDTHILIEGDNFHALTTMNMMCGNEGFVDLIYIDPPYNTGNKDFVYDDKYIDNEDGYRHSKWLDFMNKRLKIARTILKDSGVIFISIDDNEIANLRLLCDSIFGERNFVNQITLLCNPKGRSQDKYFATCHEYLLVYSKTVLPKGSFSIKKTNDKIEKDYKREDERGRYRLLELRNTHREFDRSNRPNLYYPIYVSPDAPKGSTVSLTKDEQHTLAVYPLWPDGHEGCWTWGQTLSQKDIHLLVGQKKGRNWKIYRKAYAVSGDGTVAKQKMFSIWREPEYYTEKGQVEFGKIFLGSSKNDFPQPKAVEYIKAIIRTMQNNEGTVLDFFAGSGTTAQAVLELNKEDGGHRKCILCTNNEGNICSDITYPRIKTVITGKRADDTEYSEGIPANLMYYKTDFIEDSRDSDQAKYCLVEQVDELLCIVEETYVAKERTDRFSHYESFSGGKHTFIYSDYYSEDFFNDFKNLIESCDGEKVVYMFSTDNTVEERLFDGVEGVKVKPIPNKIYEIYKEIVEDIKRGEQ